MRKIYYFLMLFAAVFTMGIITACGDDDEDNTPTWENFFDVKFTRCERVGTVLVLEFDVTNKSGKDIRNVNIDWKTLTDNAGNTYVTPNEGKLGVKGAADIIYWNVDVAIDEGQTKKFIARMLEFDKSNSATKAIAGLVLKTSEISDMPSNEVLFTIGIVDNRVMNHGIQTNDVLLDYKLEGCKVEDGKLCVSFTLTNNLGFDLKHVETKVYDSRGAAISHCTPSDDLGNTYREARIGIGGSGNMEYEIAYDLDAGASKTFSYNILGFDTTGNAKSTSFGLSMKCSNYFLCEEYVHFVNIPIEGR